jgi:hypothetical protein
VEHEDVAVVRTRDIDVERSAVRRRDLDRGGEGDGHPDIVDRRQSPDAAAERDVTGTGRAARPTIIGRP